jgi:protocatechuate 4,5-dioxygenase beta chain
MATLVELAVVPHDPTLPATAQAARDGKGGANGAAILKNFETLRQKLAAARPDTIVLIGSDHLGQWFYDQIAPFVIGKATRMKGPAPSEIKAWGLAECDVPIDGALARQILKGGLNKGVDFAFSDEFFADHSFTIPLGFLRPEHDLPVVPVFINLLVPPTPPGWRYRQVGHVIRQAIEENGDDKRVAVIATGHFVNSVGGPGMLELIKQQPLAWDTEMWGLILANQIDEVTKRATWDQLYALGNGTPGFLGYVFALGLADGARPSHAEFVATGAQPAVGFLEWDEAALNGERR